MKDWGEIIDRGLVIEREEKRRKGPSNAEWARYSAAVKSARARGRPAPERPGKALGPCGQRVSIRLGLPKQTWERVRYTLKHGNEEEKESLRLDGPHRAQRLVRDRRNRKKPRNGEAAGSMVTTRLLKAIGLLEGMALALSETHTKTFIGLGSGDLVRIGKVASSLRSTVNRVKRERLV